jgi:hypothetical protein
MTIPTMLGSYKAEPRNVAYLMERACIAAADAESFGPSLARVRARDARCLIRMAQECDRLAIGGTANGLTNWKSHNLQNHVLTPV